MALPSAHARYAGWTTNDFLAAVHQELVKLRAQEYGYSARVIDGPGEDWATIEDRKKADASKPK